MGMKRFMSRLGVGGAEVDTVLDRPETLPGHVVTGLTTITGGKVEQEIEKVLVSLEATVEVDRDDSTYYEQVTFGTQQIGGGVTIRPEQKISDRFELPVPWQTPITDVGGWHLRGMKIGVRTRLAIPGAVDPGDLDPVAREIDWVSKLKLIERYQAKHEIPMSHPRVAQLDLAYHDVRRGRGLYALMEKRKQVDRIANDLDIFEAKETPPQTTRARLRGEFIRHAQEKRRDFTVDWVHLKLNDQAQRTVLCKDPFRAYDERVERLIASM